VFAGAYAFAADVDQIAAIKSRVKYESTQIYKGAIIKCLLQQKKCTDVAVLERSEN
jgi:hypothetical protein